MLNNNPCADEGLLLAYAKHMDRLEIEFHGTAKRSYTDYIPRNESAFVQQSALAAYVASKIYSTDTPLVVYVAKDMLSKETTDMQIEQWDSWQQDYVKSILGY